MGFGISFTSFSGREIGKKVYYTILDAEDNGLTTCRVDVDSFLDSKLEEGQIIFYESAEERQFKNYWKISKIGSDEVWKDMEGGGRLKVSGGVWLIFEELPSYSVDTTTTQVPYDEVINVKEQLKELGYAFNGFIITSEGKLGKLIDVVVSKTLDNEKTYHDKKFNPNAIKIEKEVIRINIVLEGSDLDRYDFVEKFVKKDFIEFDSFIKSYFPIQWGDYKQIQSNIDDILTGVYTGEQFLIGSSDSNSESSVEENNSLVSFGDNEHLKLIAKNNEKKVKLTQGIIFFDKRTVDLQREEVNRMMANIKSKGKEMIAQMNLNIIEMNNKIREMYRLIDTIEIFTGVDEEIYQIQEGSDSTTNVINLYQKKLYMDEEVGVWEDGGMDFKDIKEFDKWVCNGIDRIIPSEIGIVVMQPRRSSKKDYTREFSMADIFQKAMEDEANSHIYIIIRNGSNIYRIWSDKIPHHKRLFPLQDEFQNIVNKISEAELKMAKDLEYYNRVMNEKEMVDSKDELFFYIRNFLLIQGLIHRTKIFSFIPENFNIMNVDTHDGMVNYIYDDENHIKIGNALPTFSEWTEKINSGMKRGKKVFLFPNKYNTDMNYSESRFNLFFNGRKPNLYPNSGIYTVKSEKMKTERQHLHTITEKEFLESDKVWRKPYWNYSCNEFVENGIKFVKVEKIGCKEDIYFEEEEQFYITFFQSDKYEMFYNQWIRFRIYPSDKFLICYEDIDDETLDFYMTDREARRHYLTSLPLLQLFKDAKAKDAEIEKYYIDMVLSQVSDVNIPENDKISVIKEAIEFWKFGGKTFVNTFSTIKKGSVDEIKSVKVILDETKRILKKRFKVDIILNVNVRNKIQYVSSGRYDFYVKGLTKKEFVDKLSDMVTDTKKKLNATCNVLIDENKIKEIEPQLVEGVVLTIRKY